MSQRAEIPSHPQPDESRGPRGRGFLLLWAIVLLPVIYVLSLGPSIYILPDSVIRLVYGPLIKFEAHCPPLDRFQTWYMEKVWGCKMW
jgi:hypothetical protein